LGAEEQPTPLFSCTYALQCDVTPDLIHGGPRQPVDGWASGRWRKPSNTGVDLWNRTKEVESALARTPDHRRVHRVRIANDGRDLEPFLRDWVYGT
jgi:hypothetical protein